MTNLPTIFGTEVFDKLFGDEIGNEFRKLYEVNTTYPYNIYTKDDVTVIEFALAGFSKEEISVVIEDDLLVISTDSDDTADEIVYKHHGIAKRNMITKFTLGSKVDKDNIKSSFENGLLKIELPIKTERKVIELM